MSLKWATGNGNFVGQEQCREYEAQMTTERAGQAGQGKSSRARYRTVKRLDIAIHDRHQLTFNGRYGWMKRTSGYWTAKGQRKGGMANGSQ